MRGPASRQSTTNRNANVIVSQKSWLGNVSYLNGGNPGFSGCDGATVPAVAGAASAISGKEQDKRDQKAEQALQLAKGIADVEVGELRLGRARVAQRARNVVAEHHADARTGAHEGDGGKAGTDI